MTKKQKKILIRIIASGLLLVVISFIPLRGVPRFLLYLVPYLIIGYDVLLKAIKGIKRGRIFDENFLMAVATVGAIVLGATHSGDYLEAIAVMLFYQVGELFQSYAIGKSRKNISELMDIRPDYANIEKDGELIAVSPDEVQVGSVITVNPGEKVPLDGIVISGYSSLNQSALTGESLPKDVAPGEQVLSGTINISGRLLIRTTKEAEESTASKILDLVENASSRKSKSEAFISKFARIYTPIVCYSALALAIIPPVVILLFSASPPHFEVWIYRALSFLVASCPCALVISIPLSFFAGLGGAGKEGILIKGSNYLEALAKTKYVVFDKTGTLTKGVFEVTEIHNNKMDEKDLLFYAALAESGSSHPIAQSLKAAVPNNLDLRQVTDVKEISGKGVTAKVNGKLVAVGNNKLMKELKISFTEYSGVGTAIYVAIDGVYAGSIIISDVIKPTSKRALSSLKKIGIKKTVMLTGDASSAAQKVSKELMLDEFYGELLPEDKVFAVENLLSQKPSGSVLAFVGDGINDAPVLSRADIGIAMGGIGSDAAIEAADIVLMDDNPQKITKAIKIAKKCLSIVYQNIIFAIGVKALALILVALGIANMWLAVFADVGVTVIAVLNAIRALLVKKL